MLRQGSGRGPSWGRGLWGSAVVVPWDCAVGGLDGGANGALEKLAGTTRLGRVPGGGDEPRTAGESLPELNAQRVPDRAQARLATLTRKFAQHSPGRCRGT